jgi:hypothetical protein
MAKASLKGSGKPIPRIEIDQNPSSQQREALLTSLEERFNDNMARHKGLEFSKVRVKLEGQPQKLASLFAMESSGGEPDVVAYNKEADEFIFFDCSEQSPEGRRKICYDNEGQQVRENKGVHPAGNAVDLAAAMGVELLDEDQYRQLQALGEFDTKTESWLLAPASVRELGGAIFGDRRYDRVFIFHNSPPSFYSSRGFRACLKV